jgi:hydrogenase maturation protease
LNPDVINPDSENRTLVIGIGNPLCCDDGLGVRAAQWLAKQDLPPGVQVEELGTPGWGLVNHFQGWQRVFLIDAVQMGTKPGTCRRLGANETRLISENQSISLHEPGLADSLSLAQALNLLPEEIILFGVEPAFTGPGLELSPEVQKSIPSIVENILEELWKPK